MQLAKDIGLASGPSVGQEPAHALYCISDLHLCDGQPALTALFEQFIQQIQADCVELWILGDLFESWLGDDDDSTVGTIVTQRLLLLSRNGVRIKLLQGNRDFLLSAAFASRCGGVLIADETALSFAGFNLRVLHGDSACTDDLAYQSWRKTSRTLEWQASFLAKSLDHRKAFAKAARTQSSAHQKTLAPEISDVSASAIAQLHQRYLGEILLHGHTHRPAIHRGEFGVRVVLGDWGPEPSWLKITSGQIELQAGGTAVFY
jgi:UDP-2,3-diacylglucosamine hydrolase